MCLYSLHAYFALMRILNQYSGNGVGCSIVCLRNWCVQINHIIKCLFFLPCLCCCSTFSSLFVLVLFLHFAFYCVPFQVFCCKFQLVFFSGYRRLRQMKELMVERFIIQTPEIEIKRNGYQTICR